MAGASRQKVDLIQTVVQVTCLEMVGLSGDLFTSHVNDVGVVHGEFVAGCLEGGGFGVI